MVFQAARWPPAAPLFDRVPALVWSYAVPMLLTSAGVLPADSPLYAALARYLLPASLVLLLLSSEIRQVARLGPRALLVMAAGIAGVMLGGVVAFAVFRTLLPHEGWKAIGTLTATWIGGSANLLAVATSLGLSPELQGVIIVVDTVVGYSWMGLLIALAAVQGRFDAWNRADRGEIDAIAARLKERRERDARPPRVADVTLMVGLAIGLTALCLELGTHLPPVGKVLNDFAWAILLLSTASLLLSLTPLARLEDAGASTIGYAGFYLLLASVGARADLRRVAEHPYFVLVGLCIIAVHAVVLLAAVRLLRAPLFFFAAASQACTGGYSSAPLVAGLYLPAMAPVGLLLAVLGNVLGTYLGLLVAQVLASW
jgi:uncharacterized membrane protein